MSVVSSEITPGPGTVLPFSLLIDAAALLLPLIIDTMYLETWRPGEAGHVVVGWELGICRRPGGLATRKSTLVNQVQDHC